MSAPHVAMLTPFAPSTNPYLTLLVDALRERGAEVTLEHHRGFLPLVRIMRERGRPDIVHLQWQHRYLAGGPLPVAVVRGLLFLLEWRVLRKMGVRTVWTIHNVVNHERAHEEWELSMCRRLARQCDRIIAHCEVARGTVAEAYGIPPERITVIPHGRLDAAKDGDPSESRSRARRRLGLDEDSVLFLGFGIVRRYKGFDDLIEAFGHLEPERIGLMIVGRANDAELAAQLGTRAAEDERIRLRLEYVPDDELTLYLQACDVVVLPYKDSLTSGAALLAAGHGRPIIAPRRGCISEFPPDAAILYDGAGTEPLTDALRQALDAPLDRMGRAAHEHVTQFRWDEIAAATRGLYEELAGASAHAVGS